MIRLQVIKCHNLHYTSCDETTETDEDDAYDKSD